MKFLSLGGTVLCSIRRFAFFSMYGWVDVKYPSSDSSRRDRNGRFPWVAATAPRAYSLNVTFASSSDWHSPLPR